MDATEHTYQEINRQHDCPICNRWMDSTDKLAAVTIQGKLLLAHWECRRAFLSSK